MFKAATRRLKDAARGHLPPAYPYKSHNIRHKAIFIHVPKTGGTSIRSAMGAPEVGRLHVEYIHYMLSDREKFADYYKFSVVRDPLTRMFSCYRYMLGGGNQSEKGRKISGIVQSNSRNFDDFVGFVADRQLHASWQLLKPQSSFLCDVDGTVMVDLVLHQETLAANYPELTAHVPTLGQNLPALNVSGTGAPVACSDETRATVARLYGQDYDLFYS